MEKELKNKDYELLRWVYQKGNVWQGEGKDSVHISSIVEGGKQTILEVKRLSDGVVFKVGDRLTKDKIIDLEIISIQVIDDQVRIYPQNSFYLLKEAPYVKKEK